MSVEIHDEWDLFMGWKKTNKTEFHNKLICEKLQPHALINLSLWIHADVTAQS